MARLSFHIFIAGRSNRNDQLVRYYREACDSVLGADACDITVIDLARDPKSGEQYKILAIPTICRTHPTPEKRIIGNLTAETATGAVLFLIEDINHTKK